jgi:WD40 repeat protein
MKELEETGITITDLERLVTLVKNNLDQRLQNMRDVFPRNLDRTASNFYRDLGNGLLRGNIPRMTDRVEELARYLTPGLSGEMITQRAHTFHKQLEECSRILLTNDFEFPILRVSEDPPKAVRLAKTSPNETTDEICAYGGGMTPHLKSAEYFNVCEDGLVQCRLEADDRVKWSKNLNLGEGEYRHLNCIAISPDGASLAVSGCESKSIHILDPATGDQLREIKVEWNPISIIFSGTDELVVGYDVNVVGKYGTTTGTKLAENELSKDIGNGIYFRALLPDGTLVAGTVRGHLLFFSSSDLRLSHSILNHHKTSIGSLTANKRGTFIVTGGDDNFLKKLDYKSKKTTWERDLGNKIEFVALDHSEQWIMTFDASYNIKLISSVTGEIITSLSTNGIPLRSGFASRLVANVFICGFGDKSIHRYVLE